MAYLMAALCSGRKNGYSASLMKEAVNEAQKVDGVRVEVFHLHDYRFGPCTSCFACARSVGGGCVIDDDWGQCGEGLLYKAFKRANALLIVDAVHQCGTSAMGKLFMERVYPVFWEGNTSGLPFGSISCASNQGFQDRAREEYCKIAYGHGFRYYGGVAAHTAVFETARVEAAVLGHCLALAAMDDADKGRRTLSDEEVFSLYRETPWNAVEGYLASLTDGTFSYESSLPARAIARGGFLTDGASELLAVTCKQLRKVLEIRRTAGNNNRLAVETAFLAKLWTHATFREYLEDDVIRATIPETYRPLARVAAGNEK